MLSTSVNLSLNLSWAIRKQRFENSDIQDLFELDLSLSHVHVHLKHFKSNERNRGSIEVNDKTLSLIGLGFHPFFFSVPQLSCLKGTQYRTH